MKYGLKQFRKDFPTDQACLEFAFDTLHSRECSCGGRNTLMSTRKQFYCTRCRKQTAVLVGTIFERSLIPLFTWFRAILMVETGSTAKGIQQMAGCTYKTAYRMKTLIVSTQIKSLRGNDRRRSLVRAITVKTKR